MTFTAQIKHTNAHFQPAKMRFSIATITALLAAAATAAPAPVASPNPTAVLERAAEAVEKRDCKFNASITSNWGESGLTRYRTRFSTTKQGVDMCGVMNAAMASTGNCGGIQNNYACYFSNAENSWVVDANEVSGQAGWNAIQCEVHNAINWACNNLGK